MCETTVNRWTSPAHALEYLDRADSIPHRADGEAELLAWLPSGITRVLDLAARGETRRRTENGGAPG